MGKKNNHVIFDMFEFDECNASSVMECTGLIPSAPQNEEELRSYDDIIDYSPRTINIYNNKHTQSL